MRIRIPNFIGKKIYFKLRIYEKQCTVEPVIRIENEFYTHKPIKTNHGKAYRIGVKYYLVIGGRKK